MFEHERSVSESMLNSPMYRIALATKQGDKDAQEEYLQHLRARFFNLASHILRRHSVLGELIDSCKMAEEVCDDTLHILKDKYAQSGKQYEVSTIMAILHNQIDDKIANILTELAKKGNTDAKEALFILLSKKLKERILTQRWENNFE